MATAGVVEKIKEGCLYVTISGVTKNDFTSSVWDSSMNPKEPGFVQNRVMRMLSDFLT